VIARVRTSSAELRELLKYYWATIEECVPPEKIVSSLGEVGFQKVERRRFGPMLNDYYAEK
jgi:demethylmenaquinone methyltransferase/2-methoxy-6-polyprenyl-1,4-benzoquinol methylase